MSEEQELPPIESVHYVHWRFVHLGVYRIEVVIANLSPRETKGEWWPIKDRIYIDATLGPKGLNEVFLHELLHAIETYYSIELIEQDVATFGMALAQLLDGCLDVDYAHFRQIANGLLQASSP